MKIGIEALKLNSNQPSGIEGYLFELLAAFKRSAKPFIAYDNPMIFSESFTRNFLLPLKLNSEKLDIVHFPDHILPIIKVKAKTVITVHDLAFVMHPECYSYFKRNYKRFLAPRSLKRADKIIAVSNNTKRDIINIYNIPDNKIEVIYNGISDYYKQLNLAKKAKEELKRQYQINFNKVVLFVGTIEPRKNLDGLLNAFEKIIESHKDIGLVISGKAGWLSEGLLKKMNMAKNVMYLGHAKKNKLLDLYNIADLFVYPSFYEGFGFPPLEAMACGCPVISSNVSSIPEILEDAAILVNPQNRGELVEAINKVLDNSSFRETLIEKGLKQARKYSWDRTAAQTYKVYGNI